MNTTLTTARRTANSYAKAKTMTADGYKWNELAKKMYRIFKPENTTQDVADYVVDMMITDCTCPDFQRNGTCCKHTLWIEMELEKADEAEMWESICAEHDREEEEGGFIFPALSDLTKMRNLLHVELTEAENKAMKIFAEPFAQQTAVRSWLNKADRCKKALLQFDETMQKIECGLLAL